MIESKQGLAKGIKIVRCQECFFSTYPTNSFEAGIMQDFLGILEDMQCSN